MSNFIKRNYLIFLLVIFFGTFKTVAQIKLPKLISDNAILQRDTDLKIWGWAGENEDIQLKFRNQVFETSANNKGEWEFQLPAQKAGGPYTMEFYASDTLRLKNILFGDVYLGSGQSNMETTMERVSPLYSSIIANSTNEEIRQFLVPDNYNFKKPSENLSGGSWKSANPETLKEFSAVGYFFARNIHDNTRIPIGFINSAMGGSPISAWLSAKSLKKFPAIYKEHKKFQSDSLIATIEEENQQNSEKWYQMLTKRDKGLSLNYLNEDSSNWESTEIPGYWSEMNILDSAGVVWYKKVISLSERPKIQTGQLNLGRLIDSDQAYINGRKIGATGYQYPPRRYKFDAGILKEGKNEITVRLVNNGGQAGFVDDKPYELILGKDTLDLRGNWKFKIGAIMPDAPGQIFVRWKPGGLYNAMIAPLQNYPIKGVLWYQGESDAENPDMYNKLFPQLINSWRSLWNQPDLPFLYVQLPNFMKAKDQPGESNWAQMREVQRRIKDSLKNTGMAVTIDIGEWNDIHPLNKKDVGERLALQARKLIYKERLLANSPEPKSFKVSGNEVIIHFEDVGKGLKTLNSKSPQSFALSEDGKNYYWAEAELLDEASLKLSSNKVAHPKFVRYAWADNPDKANLYNSEDLPATPFELVLE